ncbi:hypothetical protein PybrP1_008597 [[Pythium] brassicae (nom. inval.)]|nr:hypothetical protein PybrP1_008597 [[Pythium] brassicae (nom. inval.)]
MGIRGLTTFCERNEARVSTVHAQLRDVTLAVDFVGFLFDVCERLSRQAREQHAARGESDGDGAGLSPAAWLLLGGCPDRLEQQLERWLCALRAANVSLVFIADPPQCFGGEDHRKGYCLQDRVLQKLDKLRELKRSLFAAEPLPADSGLASTNPTSNGSSSDGAEPAMRVRLSRQEHAARLLQELNVCFPFAREKVRSVLHKFGIPVRTAAREADEELAELVRSQHAFAVLGHDSDFLCMRGARYIPFSQLVVDDALGDVSARVYTPALVARALGLREEQLVDLALVCSNDLTPLLDAEFGMATKLHFPVQRVKQGTRALPPHEAAAWIATQVPVLVNPVLPQLEAATPGLLRALYEIYRFYGYADAFLARFPLAEAEPALPVSRLSTYTRLLDEFEFPTSAVDVMETRARTFSNRFDPLVLVGGSVHSLVADVRQLQYQAMNVLRVREFAPGDELGHEVALARPVYLRDLHARKLDERSPAMIDAALRDLVMGLLFPAAAADSLSSAAAAEQLDTLGTWDQNALDAKTVVYSLLTFRNCDALYLRDSPSLLNDRQLEILLLTSLLCLHSSPSASFRGGPTLAVPEIAVHEQTVEWGLYATVSVYLDLLKKFYDLRVIAGAMHRSTSWTCATFFSSEVLLRVCHTLSDGRGLQAAWSDAANPSVAALSKQQVKRVVEPIQATLAVDVDAFWAKFAANGTNGVLASQFSDLSLNGRSTVSAKTQSSFSGMMPTSVMKSKKKKKKQSKAKSPSAQRASSASQAASAQQNGSTTAATSTPQPQPQQQQVTSTVASPTQATKPQGLKGLMETLPVFQHRDEILTNVKNNQITIIQGETGCGKSTSVPQFLLDAGLRAPSLERSVNIFVTQPRRIAAIELANTVAAMRVGNAFGESGRVGDVVGYRIGQKQLVSGKTKITYVTTGYMVERLIHDPDALKTITHLVLDEVHERSMDVDLLLLLLRLKLNEHPHVRLVVMSATMDAQVILQYFANALATRLQNKKPLFVGSKLFPVENVFLDRLGRWFPSLLHSCKNELVFLTNKFAPLVDDREPASSEAALARVSMILERQLVVAVELLKLLIHSSRREKDAQCVLVFLPGINAINALFETLSELATSVQHEIVSVYVLHSSLELEYQQEAFRTIAQRSTKIILSTNIAESSVTIPDVTHVINCGVEKQIDMPNAGSSHAEVLIDSWCSRASAKQRAGRAGRVMPGVAFHLFPEAFHDTCLLEYSTPEMLRKPLDRIILLLKGKMTEFGTPSVLLTKALDAPDLQHIEGAYKVLAHFDAIDSPHEAVAKMTTFGAFVCHLPLNLHLCRLVMTGMSLVQGVPSSLSQASQQAPPTDGNNTPESWPLLLHVVILAAVLGVPDLFLAPSFYHASSPSKYLKEMGENLRAKLEADADGWSEPLAIWRMYLEILVHHSPTQRPNLGALCHARAISFRRLQTLNFTVSDICNRLIALPKKDPAGVFSRLLDTNSRVNDYLLNFAVTALAGETRAEDVLRFLVVHNYDEHVIGGVTQPMGGFDDDDLSALDRVDLRVDSTTTAAFTAMKNKSRVEMFEQLASRGAAAEAPNEFAAIAFDGKVVSLYTHAESAADERRFQALLPRMSFPVSLLYYVRDQRFPVDFGARAADGLELKLRFRVGACNGAEATWLQQKDNVKVMLGGRSLFTLPVRAGDDGLALPSQKMLAVYAERMFTGSEARMVCSKCTLLPPGSVAYYPTLLLLGVRQGTTAWLYVNCATSEIVTVKVDGQVATLPPMTGIRLDILDRLNVVRQALSDALHGGSEAGKRVNAADLLALADDSSYVMRRTKAKNPSFEWRQVQLPMYDKETLKDMEARGVPVPRFPPLLV